MRKPLELKYKFTWSPELDPERMSEDTSMDIFKVLIGFQDKSDEEFIFEIMQRCKEARLKKSKFEDSV